MSAYETLKLTDDGKIAEIRLCRPDLLNRFDALAHEEFLHATHELKEKRSLRAVIISAEGRAFSAGGDIQELVLLRKGFEHRQKMLYEGKEIIQNLLEISAPVIAAVQGDAVGLGSSIITLCDIAVVYKDAKIMEPHVAVGLVAGDGGSLAWPHSIGMMRAKRYLLTGEPVKGDLAFEMGLISDVVATPEEALPLAQMLANKIASLSPLAVQGTKKALSKLMKHRMEEVQEYAFLLEEKSMMADDCQEALDAWIEKRKPEFKGS